ncbi:MAG: NAD-dependent epimerase/dehydratase family protein, partial [Burkholderiales bacterium]|nr:NAD-dependent epimerase/dehydratase family protein [Anaerolineae bacterium]
MANIRTQGIPRPTALVTGATGALGPALVEHLLAEGYAVRTLSRNLPCSKHLNPAIEFISGSITDADALDRALEGVDFVFHLAALLHVINPAAELAAEYTRVNVEGTRLVAERAARAGVRRMIYFSTVKVYGTRQRQPITETHPTTPTTLYARSKLDGEHSIQSIPNIEMVVLRLSPVYGPRLKGSWAQLVNAVARNRFVPIGSLRNVHSLTHVDDVVQAALLAANHPAACGQTFNLVGHESPTLHDILSAIYAAQGKYLPALRVPSALAL